MRTNGLKRGWEEQNGSHLLGLLTSLSPRRTHEVKPGGTEVCHYHHHIALSSMAVEHEIRTRSGKTMVASLTALSAIRAYCLECVNWSFEEVRECPSLLCPLYPFRFGKNPSRKGMGGNPKLARKS